MPYITANDFESVLRKLPQPGGNQQKFLAAHSLAVGRAMTATMLADSADYETYDGINLQYGKLAKRIGEELGIQDANLSLFCDFIKPGTLTNTEWILIMHSEFAEGLRRAGWIQ